MNHLGQFISLMQKSEVSEAEDSLELNFDVACAQELSIDLDEWIKNDVIGLFIDLEWADSWGEINDALANDKCRVTLTKSKFIERVIQVETDANQFVFFSIDYFQEWLSDNSNPFFATHPLYKADKNLIWINEFPSQQLGVKLSIMPLGSFCENYFHAMESSLPEDREIRSQVHFVSRDPVRVMPERFRLPDSAIKIKELKPFFWRYAELLSACLIKEYYSPKHVVISGIKRLSLSLSASKKDEIYLDDIKILEDAVRWVYAERTETRLILLMDRVSLDLPENSTILPSLFESLGKALEQAKYRYEFVIKDRQEAHAKELADLQKDVKSATEGYSQSTNAIVSGFLKDTLSMVFVLAVGVLSRLIGKEELLQSKQSHFLFKGLSIYLLISLISKLFVNKIQLDLALKDIQYWKEATRNHMSDTELEGHIKKRTTPYKKFYCRTAVAITFIYLILCYFVLDFPAFMSDTPLMIEQIPKYFSCLLQIGVKFFQLLFFSK